MSTVTELREKIDTQDAKSTIPEDVEMGPTATVRKKPMIGVLQVLTIVVLMVLAFVYSRAPGKPVTIPATQNISSALGKPAPLVSVVNPQFPRNSLP